MKANELRIGNYTKVKDMNCVVYSFYENGIHIELGKYFHFQELEPIRLTRDWLIKLGFKQAKTDNEYLKSFFSKAVGNGFLEIYCSYDKDLEEVSCGVTNLSLCKGIVYVHQLQNLYFALTGEELTIK